MCLQHSYVYPECAASKSECLVLRLFLFSLPSHTAMCPDTSTTQMTIYGPANGTHTTTAPATELLLDQPRQKTRPDSGYVCKRLSGKCEVALFSHYTWLEDTGIHMAVSQGLLVQDNANSVCKACVQLRAQTKQLHV